MTRSSKFERWRRKEAAERYASLLNCEACILYHLSQVPEQHAAVRNAVLRALPPAELARLRPYLHRVELKRGVQIFSPGESIEGVLFIEEGAVSRLAQLPGGESVEAGIIGNEGFIGLPLALGKSRALSLARVQIPGEALLLSAADLDAHVHTGSPLMTLIFRYANLFIEVLGQLTLCHCLHRIEQRLCRCLLTLHDHNPSDDLRITHDTLAEFLGVHRPSVTYALASMAGEGTIGMERRRIIVRDREGLMARVCECYDAIRTATNRELESLGGNVSRRVSSAP